MQQYFAKDKNLNLEDGDYHHIKNVMRMKKGDLIKVVFNNTIYLCKIKSVRPEVSFDVVDKAEGLENNKQVVVAFSLINEQKQNYLLQKSTELGAFMFIPVQTKRSIIKFDKKREKEKISRWQRIIKEASEQSFRTNIPIISNVVTINDLVSYEADLKILLTVNEKSKNIKKVLQKNSKCDKIIIVIGPPGGFDSEEETLLNENGFISTTLGKNVLRSETAPVAVLSMINYEFMR